MKKLTFCKSLFLLCALIVGSTSAWADDEITFSEYYSDITGSSKKDINDDEIPCGNSTIVFHKVSGSNNPQYYANGTAVRVYNKSTITVSSSDNIASIVVTSNNGVPSSTNFTAESSDTDQEMSYNGTNKTATWSGDAKSVTFTVTATLRITNIAITYATSSDPSSAVAFTTATPSINFPAQTTYSQIATTASGYTGTVGYEITANTAGATIDGSTVTVTQEGSVTVKATAPAVTGWAKSEASYTLTVTDTRADNGLEFEEDAQEVTVGEVLSAPTLTNPNNLTVTYSSDDETIATVDASGNVTGVAAGSTTIKATFAGNNSYKAGSVSYTITVKKAAVPAVDGVFDFSYDDEIDYGTGLQPSTDDIKAAKTFTAGNVTLTPEPTANNKYWRWWTDGTLRLYTDSKMTIAVPNDYVITSISFTGTQNLNAITVSAGEYEAASGNKSATWTGCSNSIVFTRDGANPFFTEITVTYTTANQTFTPAKTYTTLTSAYALNFTDVSGLKAFIAKDGVSEGSVKMTQVNKVPAGTGLVLKATTPNSAVNIPVFDGTGADDVSGNLMVGSATETTAIEKDGGYILKDGVFQPASAGTLAAGKAYLQIAVTSARSLEMSFDDATTAINGIEEVTPVNVKTRKVVKNGRLVIETANGEFTIDGARMK